MTITNPSTRQTATFVERSFDVSKAWATKVSLLLLDLMAVFLGLSVAGQLAPRGVDARLMSVILLVLWAFFMARGRLYSARFITRRADEVRRMVNASCLAVAGGAVAAFLIRLEVGRAWLLLAWALSTTFLVLEREVIRNHYDRRRQAGELSRRVVMVGDNMESNALAVMFQTTPALGYQIVSTVDPKSIQSEVDRDGRNSLTTAVLAAARQNEAVGAVIATTAIDTVSVNRLLRDLIESGLHVEMSSTLTDIDPSRLTVRPLGRFPVVYVEPVLRGGWRKHAKRTFDVVMAATALTLLAPILLIVAAAIKLTSSGPILFRQQRVGQGAVPFELLKLRTMVENAEDLLEELATESDSPLFKMKNDPRITRVGRWLRSTSLDELPQLWNVLRGDMSLVGPRPALASEMSAWGDDLYRRLRVKPGITGMWQVSGRSEASFEDYTRLDLYYVDNWSLVVDLLTVARTIPAVLRRKGAY